MSGFERTLKEHMEKATRKQLQQLSNKKPENPRASAQISGIKWGQLAQDIATTKNSKARNTVTVGM